MPIFAGLGALVAGMIGVAGPVTAGTAAMIGTISAGVIAGGVYAAGSGLVSAMSAGNRATGEYTNAAGITNVATTVDPNSQAAANTRVNQLGRAALIGTSPQGVQGTSDTGRYKLLGNTGGLGN